MTARATNVKHRRARLLVALTLILFAAQLGVSNADAQAPLPTPKPSSPIYSVACGNVDDTAAIQAALNQAGNYSPGSAAVSLTSSACAISSTLVYYGSGAQLFGLAGGAGTTIRNVGANIGKPMLKPKFTGFAVTNFGLARLKLDQATLANGFMPNDTYAVDVGGTYGMTIDGVTFTHINVLAVWSGVPTQGNTIMNSTVTDSLGGGFSFFGAYNWAYIHNNTISNCRDDAIAFQAHGPGTPTNDAAMANTITGCTLQSYVGPGPTDYSTANGINAYGADHTTISGNTITNVFSNCIRVGGASDVRNTTNTTVEWNSVTGCGAGNTGTITPANGISFLRADTALCDHNSIGTVKAGYQAIAVDAATTTGITIGPNP